MKQVIKREVKEKPQENIPGLCVPTFMYVQSPDFYSPS